MKASRKPVLSTRQREQARPRKWGTFPHVCSFLVEGPSVAVGQMAEPWSQPFHSICGSGPEVTNTTKRGHWWGQNGDLAQQSRICTAWRTPSHLWRAGLMGLVSYLKGIAWCDDCPLTSFPCPCMGPWKPCMVSYTVSCPQ